MLSDYLGRYGFHVYTVHRGDTGLKEALKKQYALILLDVILPGLDGFEVLKRIRAVSSSNVLLLTARGDDVDRIVGLEIGADDYLRHYRAGDAAAPAPVAGTADWTEATGVGVAAGVAEGAAAGVIRRAMRGKV
jgi:DNA-binding NarL/FixJ family response regulator